MTSRPPPAAPRPADVMSKLPADAELASGAASEAGAPDTFCAGGIRTGSAGIAEAAGAAAAVIRVMLLSARVARLLGEVISTPSGLRPPGAVDAVHARQGRTRRPWVTRRQSRGRAARANLPRGQPCRRARITLRGASDAAT